VLRFALSQDAVDSSFPDPELSGDHRSGGALGGESVDALATVVSAVPAQGGLTPDFLALSLVHVPDSLPA
jgi:hypothetical protein